MLYSNRWYFDAHQFNLLFVFLLSPVCCLRLFVIVQVLFARIVLLMILVSGWFLCLNGLLWSYEGTDLVFIIDNFSSVIAKLDFQLFQSKTWLSIDRRDMHKSRVCQLVKQFKRTGLHFVDFDCSVELLPMVFVLFFTVIFKYLLD